MPICPALCDYRTTGLRGDVRLKSGEFFRKPNIILDTKLFSTNARQECVTEKKDNKNYQPVCKAVLAPNRRTDPSICRTAQDTDFKPPRLNRSDI